MKNPVVRIFTLLLAMALSVPVLASTGPVGEISNVHQENVTQVGFDVVWTTVHASTSQLLLARDTNYEPELQYPTVPDPAMVTTHRVTASHLLSLNTASGDGQYYGYVVSVQANGTMATAPGPQDGTGHNPLLPMPTLAPVASGPPNMAIYVRSPPTVWTGHDAYIEVQAVLTSGPLAHLYIFNTGGYNNSTDGSVKYISGAGPLGTPASIAPHFSCSWENPSGLDSNEQLYDATKHLGYCYHGNDLEHGDLSLRLRVAANCAPGNYALTFTVEQSGQMVTTVVPFQVVKTPTTVQQVGSKVVLPIPRLALWQSEWLRLGTAWCTYRDAQNVQGNFVDNWGNSGDAWFYDGFRVFQQLDDYTANLLGQPNHAHWQHCAQALGNPYAQYQVTNNGNMQGYNIFPGGMTMNYWRTHDPVMLQAVNALAALGAQSVNVGYVDPYGVRENSYRANMFMENAMLGKPIAPLLQRNVDKVIGVMDMLTGNVYGVGAAVHPFQVGLGAEMLTRWYQFSVAQGAPDYRVVPVLKKAMDMLWLQNWMPQYGEFNYNRMRLPLNTALDYEALNNLNAQAYAWLWFMTGDTTEQQHAMDLFNHAFDYPAGYEFSGKQWSQMWEFSPDTVRLLQNNGTSYTAAASNPYTSAWPVTTPPTSERTNCDPNYYPGCQSGSIGSTTASIFWGTFLPSSTQVVYGLSTTYGQQTVLVPAMVPQHVISLTGLQANTTYHFRTQSVDAYGNLGSMHDLTFHTALSGAQLGDIVPAHNANQGEVSAGGMYAPKWVCPSGTVMQAVPAAQGPGTAPNCKPN